MLPKIKRLILVLGIIAICMPGFAYDSTKVNLLKNKTVRLEKVSYQGVRILHVFVQEDNGVTIISGRIKKSSSMPVSPGHIDIAVINPDGTIIHETSTQYTPKSLTITRNHRRGSRFYADLLFVPPKGSVVRVAFHETPLKYEKAIKCNDNRAKLEGDTNS